MDRTLRLILLVSVLILGSVNRTRTAALQPVPAITVVDRNNNPTNLITDGNLVSLRLDNLESTPSGTKLEYWLEGVEQPVASCTFTQAGQSCLSETVYTTGWYWDAAGNPAPNRSLEARLPDGQVLASLSVQIHGRPVVMVHGFSSDYTAWTNYLGPQGYLAKIGVPGFAVGDGQVPGVMNAGRLADPLGRTNTIAQNAVILGQYLTAVKQKTGAEQVDLLAHSMGGMISRYYIDRVMQDRDVTQLIMLGSPSLGTACANLPASLGYYLPATLEIEPDYAIQIFNPQINHRHGVPFYILAGDPIANPAGSPCTGVPSDLVISRKSATGIPLNVTDLPILHIDLNTSAEAFDGFVKPLLQKGPGAYQDEPDPTTPPALEDPIQFGQVFNGHLAAGQSTELVIPIEAGIQVASFGLYDPSRSLAVEVRGASGNVIELSAEKNSLIEVKDPQSLIYLGYGFNQPKAGIWKVTLKTTDQTPPDGSDYALTAQFVGGATLKTSLSTALPQPGQEVNFRVALSLNGQAIAIQQAAATITTADQPPEALFLQPDGDGYAATWQAKNPGLVGVEFQVNGSSPDGIEIQRSASLVLEVQPQNDQTRSRIVLILLAAGALLFLVLVFLASLLVFRGLIRRSKRRSPP